VHFSFVALPRNLSFRFSFTGRFGAIGAVALAIASATPAASVGGRCWHQRRRRHAGRLVGRQRHRWRTSSAGTPPVVLLII